MVEAYRLVEAFARRDRCRSPRGIRRPDRARAAPRHLERDLAERDRIELRSQTRVHREAPQASKGWLGRRECRLCLCWRGSWLLVIRRLPSCDAHPLTARWSGGRLPERSPKVLAQLLRCPGMLQQRFEAGTSLRAGNRFGRQVWIRHGAVEWIRHIGARPLWRSCVASSASMRLAGSARGAKSGQSTKEREGRAVFGRFL